MSCTKGIAFIMEGATEKVFYLEYLLFCCAQRGLSIRQQEDSQEDVYLIEGGESSILVMFNNVNSISQMTNSTIWFQRACVKEHPEIEWTVFLCYDTDEYNYPITKFHENDWTKLRSEIEKDAYKVEDLAAEADIEDIILCDIDGVLNFLGLPPGTLIPNGNKGKTKLRKLYRMVAVNYAYHPGEKARPLIQSLDMNTVERCAPVPLALISEALEAT